MNEVVALSKCASYEGAEVKEKLKKLLEQMDGLDFVREGMKIGIKTNLVAGIAPDKAGTTHPAVLKALCELLLEKGATVIIGDSPGGIYTQGHVSGVYKACGLVDMVASFESGVSLNDDFSIKNAEFGDAYSAKTFIFTAWLDKVDAIIDVCKLKSHAMMGMSGAVKNMFGAIPGTTKPEYHMRFSNSRAFANMLIDLNEYFKPALYVVDAVDCMEGNGPTAGEKRFVGALMASRNPYNLDIVCADVIGMKPENVETIVAACERGLGPKNADDVITVGEVKISDIKVPDFKKATIQKSITFGGQGLFGKIKEKGARLVFDSRPQVKKRECIGCRKCHDICPAGAITMISSKNGNIPSIDRSKCIKCFCCQEFCPKGAMKVHYNILGKIANHINT